MYHNIYKIRNGKYQIIKGNQYYGAFDKLEDALFERDALESVAWNIDKLCELPHKENKYYNVELPSFEHIPRYIQIEKRKNKVKWIIVKRLGTKRKRFGAYDTLEEAEKARDLYMEYDWDKKKVKKLLRDEKLQFS